MYILGINPGEHDASACVVKNGEIISFAELEKIKQIKNIRYAPPHEAIQSVLKDANITIDDVWKIAIGWGQARLSGITLDPKDYLQNKENYLNNLIPLEIFPRLKNPEIVFVPHHLSHASSGYYMSGFNDASILVVDGWGDNESVSIFSGKNKEISLINSWSFNIGLFYDRVSRVALGNYPNEGKFMGLAPYGKPKNNGLIIDNPNGGSEYLEELKLLLKSIQPKELSDKKNAMDWSDFASTMQNHFQDVVLYFFNLAKKETGNENIVFAGGCGLNCSFNGWLTRVSPGTNLYVPPVPHDAGVSLGAALYVDRSYAKNEKIRSAYYGRSFSDEEVEKTIINFNVDYVYLDTKTLLEKVALFLSEGKTVGLFQGREEIGKRALGARSFLIDPRDKNNFEKLNNMKGRELWRPLAPSILEEYANDYFYQTDLNITDFMLGALIVKEEARHKIPVAVHVDNTARPQFVRKETNPFYHQLIEEFYKLTGVPVLINTSFNLAGKPIVHHPEDAISTFINSDLDVLVINNFLMTKF